MPSAITGNVAERKWVYNQCMRTVVGVLRGGPSSEYEVSLKSGAAVLANLDKEKYEARDIFIDREGVWHSRGVAMAPERALTGVDAVFNVVHGEYGEDGTLHRHLDPLGVPYTGPTSFDAIRAFNKHLTNEAARTLGVRVPHGVLVEPQGEYETVAHSVFRQVPLPMMVKPAIGGSSVGASRVMSYHELAGALERAAQVSPKILIEEMVRGREATVGVVDNFRGQEYHALMPVEIVPPEGRFFDYEVKYNGETREIVPSTFSEAVKRELERIAIAVHKGLGMRHYSRSDFIVTRRAIYFLEVNNAQAVGMTDESLLPKALAAGGTTLSHFLDHIIQQLVRK